MKKFEAQASLYLADKANQFTASWYKLNIDLFLPRCVSCVCMYLCVVCASGDVYPNAYIRNYTLVTTLETPRQPVRS